VTRGILLVLSVLGLGLACSGAGIAGGALAATQEPPSAVPAEQAQATNPWTVDSTAPVYKNLYAVSADSPDDAWAVGCQNCYSAQGPYGPLIEHHTAAGWAIVPSPALPAPPCSVPAFSWFSAVKAFSPSDVWIGGSTECEPTNEAPAVFITHWNGKRWKTQNLPVVTTAGDHAVNGIDGFSDRHLWITATGDDTEASQGYLLYGGEQGWTTLLRPAPGVPGFSGVVAISPTKAYTASDTPDGQRVVIYHGGMTAASWKQTTLGLTGLDVGQPTSITASSASDIWIAGFNGQEWVIHYDGHAWKDNDPPPQPPKEHLLAGIAEHGPDDVWAGGYRGGSNYNLYDGWNGSSWVNWGGPNPGGNGWTFAVAAIPGTSNGFWAVGSSIFHCSC
jgi:hypothetical protein